MCLLCLCVRDGQGRGGTVPLLCALPIPMPSVSFATMSSSQQSPHACLIPKQDTEGRVSSAITLNE